MSGDAARARIVRRQWFWLHLGSYVALQFFLVTVWTLGSTSYPWYLYPLVWWGSLVAGHAVFAFAVTPPGLGGDPPPTPSMTRWLLGPYTGSSLYRTAGYLLAGLPVGILELVLVVTALALGLGLAVTLIGIPVLVGTLLLVWAVARWEGELARRLLGTPLPTTRPVARAASGVWWSRLRSLVAHRGTWTALGFLLLRLPLGIFGFVLVVTLFGAAAGGLAQPIVVAAGAETQLGGWRIDTVGEAFVFVPVSLVAVAAGPRLLLGWGTALRRIAGGMLGRVDDQETKRAVADVLRETGEADAFRVLEGVEARLGHGPFLTATGVEATLLALQETGRVTARRHGTSTTYTLRTRTGATGH